MAVNLASVFSNEIDERFKHQSVVQPGLNNNYKWSGVKTVKIYSMPTVPLVRYDRNGDNDSTSGFHRYGIPENLDNDIQELSVEQDLAYTFIIDRADYLQTQYTMAIGAALRRQMDEVVIPTFDKYVLWKIATSAPTGNTSAATVNDENAYEAFLDAQVAVSRSMGPLGGRVCFCTQRFYNYLAKLSVTFRKDGDLSQRQLISGEVGNVDGVRMIIVPETWMPSKTSGSGAEATTTFANFILTHPVATTAPKQLWDYKARDDPQGISGWLAEARFLFDAFVLKNKKGVIYYSGPASPDNPLPPET